MTQKARGTRREHAVTYEFGWPPRELSPNARVHWAKLARVKRAYRDECGWTIKQAIQAPWYIRPPVTAQVTFVVTDSRRRDADNYMAMLKPMWDALVEMGVLVDDNKDALTIEKPAWERGPEKRVVVRLIPA